MKRARPILLRVETGSRFGDVFLARRVASSVIAEVIVLQSCNLG